MKVRKTLVALAAAATLSLTACGSAEDVADGVSAGGGSDSAAAQASGALTQDTFASSVSDAQSKAKTAHMEMNVEASGIEITGSGDMAMDPESDDPEDSEMSMTLDMSIMEIDMRLVDGIMYVNMGPYSQDKFAKFDLTDESNPMGMSFDDITQQADPNAMVEQLSGSLKDFERTGETEQIDGVEATKYKLTMDGSGLEDMMEAQGSTMGGTTAEMPDKVVAYVWIGEDDLLRKLTMDIDSGTTPMSMEMTFSEWGEPVEVEAPSEDEIIDPSELDMSTM